MKTLFNADKFYIQENEKPLVSLDVFDTAIFRKVFRPTDIFNIIEDTVKRSFKEQRILAQDKARRISIFYNIMDIYEYLPSYFSIKEEIKAEIYNCYANPYILDLYNKQEADYVFISDMYLPSLVIKEMLERCGYRNPRVFVSCEMKGCKGDGKLFKRVEEVLGRKIAKHIGDNYYADIVGAQKVGIPKVEFVGPAIYKKEVITPELRSVKLRKLLIDEELSDACAEEKIGYQFASLALSFVKSVIDEATEEQTIFFNARDGFILYVIARWMLKTKKRIKYCRFSRKSCFIPALNINKSIDAVENRLILDFLRGQRGVTIKELVDTFKVVSKDYSEVLNKYQIEESSSLNLNPKRIQIMEEVLKRIQTDIYKVSYKRRKQFINYLETLGIKNGDIFVDFGYNGSMQAMIKRIGKIDLKGKYMVSFNNSQDYKGIPIHKTSFLSKEVVSPSIATLETVFSELVGTVISYEDGIPILATDAKFRRDTTKKFLRGLCKGVRDILKENINVPLQDCEQIIRRFLKFPTLEEAKAFNFNIFENGSLNENESVTWFNEYLIRRGKIKECYFKSYWKEGFKVILKNNEDLKFLESEIK